MILPDTIAELSKLYKAIYFYDCGDGYIGFKKENLFYWYFRTSNGYELRGTTRTKKNATRYPVTDKLKVQPYYHKVFRFGWGQTGKKSSLAQYKREETSAIEVSHIQERKDGTMLIWLKSFGMVSWYIETNELATVIKKYNISMATDVKIIKDEEHTH